MAGTNPRAARIAKLIQRVIASTMERQLHDKRLAGVTITDVRVTGDLQIARIYWTQLGDEGKAQGERKRAQQALRQATGKLRSLVGAKAGLRLTPKLQFVYDEVPSEAHEIEDILTVAHKRDEEIDRTRATAQYAGDEDPYEHPRKKTAEDFEPHYFEEDDEDADDGDAYADDTINGDASAADGDAGSRASADADGNGSAEDAAADTNFNATDTKL